MFLPPLTSILRHPLAITQTATSDDKKLGSTLKKLGVTNIPAIEEVNLFTNDGKVVHFSNPKVQASIAANTYVVSGPNETKQLTEMLPGIINQVLDPSSTPKLFDFSHMTWIRSYMTLEERQ